MITTKQRAYLRGLANGIDPIFQIGKGGINQNMVEQINDALEARELIKLSVLRTAEQTTRELCNEMARLTGADAVQCIGSKFVLYKQSKEHQRIFLD